MTECSSPATRSLTVTDRGLRVAVRVVGEGPPVLLLNGLSRTMDSWVHVLAGLRDRMVIMFDCPGVGESSTPAFPYAMSMLSALATRVLDAVGVDRADVVGYSHGGAIAQQLALNHSDRLRRLVLMGTSYGIGAIPGDGWGFARSLSRKPGAHVGPWGHNPFGMLWQVTAYSTWTSLPFLSSIQAPTLVIHGRRDRVVPLINARLLTSLIPDAQLSILEVGHDLQAESPAVSVAAQIGTFLGATADQT